MSKKQTSLSHSSTESDVISLDAGLRMDGLLALGLWDVVIEVLRSPNNTQTPIKSVSGHRYQTEECSRSPSKVKPKGHRGVQRFSQLNHVIANAHSQWESRLHVFEGNLAVIKMIIKGRRPTMRFVSGTRRVAVGCLFDRIDMYPRIHIKYVDTRNQLEDMITKGRCTRDEWNHLLHLLNIMELSIIFLQPLLAFVSKQTVQSAVSKRRQEASSEESGSPTAKPKPKSVNSVMAKPSSISLVPREASMSSYFSSREKSDSGSPVDAKVGKDSVRTSIWQTNGEHESIPSQTAQQFLPKKAMEKILGHKNKSESSRPTCTWKQEQSVGKNKIERDSGTLMAPMHHHLEKVY